MAKLNPIDRYGLISDMLYTGGLSPAIVLWFEQEEDIGVWYLLYSYLQDRCKESLLETDSDTGAEDPLLKFKVIQEKIIKPLR